MKPRIVCLFLPHWPLQCLYQRQPQLREQPVALAEPSAHGPRLSAVSEAAAALGVFPGMNAADARALSREVVLAEAQPQRERAELERLALWAGRFSPSVGLEQPGAHLEQPQSLLLDITGCGTLFGGEEKLLRTLHAALAKKELCARTAIAPTLGAAWALAHCEETPEHRIAPSNGDPAAPLIALPLGALRLPPEAVTWLKKVGLQTIGDVVRQPRSALPSRFGAELSARLDQALGDAVELLIPLRPPAEIHAAKAFEYPVDNLEILYAVAEKLLHKIRAQLLRRNRGVRELECWLYHEISDPVLVGVNLFKASASRKHLLQLLRTRMESESRHWRARPVREHKSGAQVEERGVCALTLRVTATEVLDAEQLSLFTQKVRTPEQLAMTLDRIGTRLGREAVLRVELSPDAQPEHACRWLPFSDSVPVADGLTGGRGDRGTGRNDAARLERPLLLLPEPAAIHVEWPDQCRQPLWFDYDGERIAIRCGKGPERIETGWWKESELVRRDYYVLEAADGARYWIFQTPDEGWFLHGLYT